MSQSSDCQFAVLTPAGRGAVATLLLRETGAAACVDRCFRSVAGQSLSEMPVGRIAVGRWEFDDDRAAEEVVVCRTAPGEIEVHCHGGAAAVKAIATSLAGLGGEIAKWTEVVVASAADAIAAEAQIALASATTQRTAQVLLDQLEGALSDAISEIIAACQDGRGRTAEEQIAKLIARSDFGLHLCKPWKVVLVGRPNVGKSSLLNAIVGHARSIVFDQPGTTRDVLTAMTAVEGWPVELADTAGLRDAGDEIERAGVRRAKKMVADADLLALVFDSGIAWNENDERLRADYPAALFVHNKCDLSVQLSGRPKGILVSAKTGENIPQLAEIIRASLVPNPPPAGAAVPFTPRQVNAISEALTQVKNGDLTAAAHSLSALLDSSDLPSL